jgi:hypothetical protein
VKPKNERAAALAVLASVGVTPDSDGEFPPWSNICVLADVYRETSRFMERVRAAGWRNSVLLLL